MSELEQYAELAKESVDPSNGHFLADRMLKLSAASARMGELLVEAEVILLTAEKRIRESNQAESQAEMAALVRSLTIAEQAHFRRCVEIRRGLDRAFKAVQSALSYLKSEMRM